METQRVDQIAPIVCESGGDCGLHQVPAPDVSIYGARSNMAIFVVHTALHAKVAHAVTRIPATKI